MQGTSAIAPAVSSARPIPAVAWRGLLQVLAGSDPSPRFLWRSRWQRWAACAGLAAGTLLVCAASLASLGNDQSATAVDSRGHGLHMSPGSEFQLKPKPLIGAQKSLPPHWLALAPGGLTTLMVLVAVGAMVPLALAVRYPLLGWRIAWLGLLLVPLLDVRWWGGLPWDPVQIMVLLVVLCAAGIRHDRPVLGWLWALTLVPWWFWAGRNGPSVVTAAFGTVAFLAMAVAVDGAGSRRRAQVALADQAEAAELERARRAVLEERARIARELHDVVAHHMSLIAVRAETAPYRLAGLPAPVRAEFGSLSGSAREAMADMRRLLGVLRSDQPPERAPQPGLPDLPGLIDTARQAGMAVELSAPPALDRVPPSAGVCAYRIVQEALSNAGRHAAGAPVAVSVHHTTQTITLQVTNSPGVPAGPRANGHGPGHGLVGMRERVELLGGSLSAGPAPDGGFVLSAVLPLGGPTA
jgi:signal transduction histidine kinase